jgi:hypothetical protein
VREKEKPEFFSSGNELNRESESERSKGFSASESANDERIPR